MLSATDVSQLEDLLLRAVLLGTPLPGARQPIQFPDLDFVLRQPSIVLLDENLSKSFSFDGGPKPLRVMSADALRQHAEQQGDIVYLQFAPPELEDDHVRMTLAARIISHEPTDRPLGLSSIHVRFRKVEREWRLVDEPVYSAA